VALAGAIWRAFADHYYLRPGGHIFGVPAELSDEAVAPVNCALSQVLYGLRVAGLRSPSSAIDPFRALVGQRRRGAGTRYGSSRRAIGTSTDG
jgi:hypothetical protein